MSEVFVFVGKSLADIKVGDSIVADTDPIGARESPRIYRVDRVTKTQFVCCGDRLQTRFSRSTGAVVGAGRGRILLGASAELGLRNYSYQLASHRIAKQLAAIQHLMESSRDCVAVVDVLEKALAHALRVAENVKEEVTR
jgi:hypothetical protein